LYQKRKTWRRASNLGTTTLLEAFSLMGLVVTVLKFEGDKHTQRFRNTHDAETVDIWNLALQQPTCYAHDFGEARTNMRRGVVRLARLKPWQLAKQVTTCPATPAQPQVPFWALGAIFALVAQKNLPIFRPKMVYYHH